MKLTAYILIFYFSLGACIPKCDFSQLLKLNDLMEHYELHQKEAIALGATISFLDFLYLHLFESDEHQHDDKNSHDNLPLQNITSTIVFYIVPSQTFIPFTNKFAERTLPSYNAILRTNITFDIFHPPRIA